MDRLGPTASQFPCLYLMIALPGFVATLTSIYVSALAHISHVVTATFIRKKDVEHNP